MSFPKLTLCRFKDVTSFRLERRARFAKGKKDRAVKTGYNRGNYYYYYHRAGSARLSGLLAYQLADDDDKSHVSGLLSLI